MGDSLATTVPLEAVRYDAQTGLVPVVVQDVQTRQVLMQAYANREALKRTLGTGQAWFWSRSRQEYWRKGATSGNVMTVYEVQMDCDGDAVLYLVSPAGPACHTGETSCFFRTVLHKPLGAPENAETSMRGHGPVNGGEAASDGSEATSDGREATSDGREAASDGSEATSDGKAVLRSHEQVDFEGSASPATPQFASTAEDFGQGEGLFTSSEVNASIVSDLWRTIESRYRDRPQGAYTTYLFEHGVDKIAKKVGEEAVEVALAAKNAMTGASGQAELASESADLLYHLLALWKQAGITPDDVFEVLRDRHR